MRRFILGILCVLFLLGGITKIYITSTGEMAGVENERKYERAAVRAEEQAEIMALDTAAECAGGLERPAEVEGTAAEKAGEPEHLLIFVVPYFSFDEMQIFWQSLSPAIRKDFLLGGMSMRTGSSYAEDDQWFTMVTGRHGEGPRRWPARDMASAANMIHEIRARTKEYRAAWHKQQGRASSEVGPGWLHKQLQQANVETFVWGQSDVYENRKLAPFLVMDEFGYAAGQIGAESVRQDIRFPSGERADFGQLDRFLNEIWSGNARRTLTVAEIGDLGRVETKWKETEEEDDVWGDLQRRRLTATKCAWVQSWAKWVDTLLQNERSTATEYGRVKKSVETWIVSPSVSAEAHERGQLLAPWMVYRPGFHSPETGGQKMRTVDPYSSWLTSETTRQAGIIANVDFLPSVLHKFDIGLPLYLTGKPWSVWSGDAPGLHTGSVLPAADHRTTLPYFKHMERVFTIYNERRPVMTVYLLSLIAAVTGCVLCWFLLRKRRIAAPVYVFSGAVLMSPVYFLWLTPLIHHVNGPVWIFLLWTVSLLTSLLLYRLLPTALFLGGIGLINSVVILFDVWQGSIWMQRSFLGFDPLIGARFYGLGNEFAGILLGSSVLAVTGFLAWYDRQLGRNGQRAVPKMVRFVVMVWYAVILMTMAGPYLGANAGATIAGGFTFVISILFLCGRPKHMSAFVIGIGVIVAGAIGFLVWHRLGEHTHIGNVWQWIKAGEWEWVQEMFRRKWEMNMRLIRVSLWGKWFVTALVGLAVFSWLKPRLADKPANIWNNGFRTMLAGALLILLVNDSGIVSAAALMIFVVFPFVSLRFSLQRPGAPHVKPRV